MMSETTRGMFVTFEGTEGSGKTSQFAALGEFLRQQGYPVLLIREPGGTQIGERIREVLLDRKYTEIHPRTEILLFQASRAQLVEQVIQPHLSQGYVVLCDRYADSTIAYQGYGYQLFDPELLQPLVSFATSDLKPDLTFYLDVDVEEGLRRRSKGGEINRLDGYDLSFYRRVRQGYLEMARLEPERWVVIDAGGPFDQVYKSVQRVILERLPTKITREE